MPVPHADFHEVWCTHTRSTEMHKCPYKVKFKDNDMCDCCDQCQRECSQEVDYARTAR